jgi:hypothetical protein
VRDNSEAPKILQEATEKKSEITEKIVEITKQGTRSNQVRCEKELKEMKESSERGAVNN